jgi:hypothetical protein
MAQGGIINYSCFGGFFMRKFINSKTIPYIVVISAVVGLALRLWTIGDGKDAFGLYPSCPLGWGLLWGLTGAVVAMILFACYPLKTSGVYEMNYPKSVAGFLGSLVAGIGMMITGFWQMQQESLIPVSGLDRVVNIGSLVAGGILIILGLCRVYGKKPHFLLHGILCLFLAARLFHHCRLWSNEPQVGAVVLPFLASLVMMLACYQRTCFDVGMGNRRHCLLWTLLGAYLCILAVLSFEEVLLYSTAALWLLTDLCSLRPLKRKKAVPEEAAPVVKEDTCETAETVRDPETMTMEELENWLRNSD